jgi:hypothetical protein
MEKRTTMLNLLNDYVATLNTEIASYEALIAKKRSELEQLTQLQGQVVEALGTLKEVVGQLKDRDPKAIAAIKEAAYRLFEDGPPALAKGAATPFAALCSRDGSLDAAASNATETTETALPSDTEDTLVENSLNLVRLSETVLYDSEAQVAHAAINSQDRARSWGNWLCYTHTVGTRFQVENESRSEGYRYDLKIEGISQENAKLLAQCDTSKHPATAVNEFWQPDNRHPLPSPPRPKTCDPGDLAVGDLAQKEDGREYRVIGVSNDGSVVKVVNGDGMEMAFSVGALYLAQKADSPGEHSQASISDTESTAEPEAEGDEPEYDAEAVRIVTDRFNGAFNGIVGKVTKRSNFGAHVRLPSNEEKFFLERELEQSLDEVPF